MGPELLLVLASLGAGLQLPLALPHSDGGGVTRAGLGLLLLLLLEGLLKSSPSCMGTATPMGKLGTTTCR